MRKIIPKKELDERLAVVRTAILFFQEIQKIVGDTCARNGEMEIRLSSKAWHQLAEHLLKLEEDGIRSTEFGHEAMLTGREFPIAHGWGVLFKEKD